MGLYNAEAQVPDYGVLSQNITITDIDGNTHDFYSILDQGTPIILDLFAEWCGPCWNYHDPNSTHPNAGALKDLHSTYGPNGSGELMVFGVDSHSGGTELELQGGQGTNGWDWITGTPYPLAVQTIGGVFNQSYYPTIVMICPDRTVTEIGQQSEAYIYNQIGSCGAASTTTNDGKIMSYTGQTESCGDINPSVTLQNFGSANLTSATIKAYIGGTEVASENWTGNLAQYEVEEVTLDAFSISQDETLTIEIDGSDDDNANNDVTQALTFVDDDYLGNVTVEILLDDYPDETSWDIRDENNSVVGSGGTYDGQSGTITETVTLNGTGCYSFTIYDDYGDGLNAEAWDASNTNGTYTLTDGDGTTIASGGGDDQWEEERTTFNIAGFSGVEDEVLVNSLTIYPNPFSETTTVEVNVDNKNVNMTLTSVLGQNVWSKNLGVVNGNKEVTLNASNLESGVYFLTVEVDGKVETKRITVNK